MVQPLRVGWLLATLVLLVASGAHAASGGVSGRSGRQGATCTDCHTGGVAPIVGITGPDRMAAGRFGTFTFTMNGGQETAGGLDVAVGAGSLSVAPSEESTTLLRNGEITHASPREGATLAWTFLWVAPDTPGTYTIYAAGASVDGDGTSDGDGAAVTTFDVTVEGCRDHDGDGYEDAACNPGANTGGGDCDDEDDAISPEAVERCDAIDQDCDGLTDEDPSLLLCDDGNPCSTDHCVDGVCESDDNTAACDDGEPCTGDDHCVDGACLGTVDVVCDDGDACTLDRCVPGEGCVATPDDGASCDDGNPCTQDDVCLEGVCAGDNLCACASDADCAPFASSDRCAGALRCDLEGAAPVCVVDAASVVVCAADGDTACSRSTCNPAIGTCALEPVADGSPCEVENACVNGATCGAGVCTGGTEVDCDDGNDCTDDVCDPAGGCLHHNAAVPCDDGDACTQGDQCRGGLCTPGPLDACEDENPCTADACDPVEGCRHELLDGAPCSDGDACSIGDVCVRGACASLEDLECDDGNPCTEDFCDPTQGCVHAESNRDCDDGDPCTLDDTCHAGRCLPGPAADCDDANPCTDDRCIADAGCAHEPVAATCDDGDACTVGDACVDGVCVARPRTCDDFDVCTGNGCDPATGCVFTAVADCCVLDEDCLEGQACAEGSCRGGDLCSPCADDARCGGAEDACVELRGGRYCGVACDGAADCPEGFECSDVPGSIRLQCVPNAVKVTCECTPQFERKCDEGDVHWYDACGNRGDIQQRCPYGCVGDRCVPNDDPGDVVVPPQADSAGGDAGAGGDDGSGGGGCAVAGTGDDPSAALLLLLLLLLLLGLGLAGLRRVRVEAVA